MYPFLFNADIVETTHQLTFEQFSRITHIVLFCTDPLRSSISISISTSSSSSSMSRDGTIDMIDSMYLVLVNITH